MTCRAGFIAAVLGFGLLAGTGCRGMRPPVTVPDLELPLQALFSIDYSGPRRGGSGKLTLRWWADENFQLDLRDPLGRQLWSIRSTQQGAWLAAPGAERFCRLTPGAMLAVTGWGDVPLRRLPHVLLGEPPLAALRVGAESATTPAGRWQFAWRDGELALWGLRRRGRPVVWWRRERGGGVLSSRRGEHLRWRLRVRESMAAPPAPASPPPAAEETSCERLAMS